MDVICSDYLLHFVRWVELDQFADMTGFRPSILVQAETLVVIFMLALSTLKTVTVLSVPLA